jgi:nucleoside triphosphate pyrophosphatase
MQIIKFNTKIILASASPRRRDLLESIGIKFTPLEKATEEADGKLFQQTDCGLKSPSADIVRIRSSRTGFTVLQSSLDEDRHASMHRYKRPAALAIALASGKAEDVGRRIQGSNVIIAADTIVVMGDKVIGKPEDEKHAGRILRLLSGKTHRVITGVCLLKMPDRISHRFSVATDITMLRMTDRDIQWYINTGEPMDKAGAYGIQGVGGLFVRKINGSYTNVVGLPLTELFDGLKKLGVVVY